MRKLPLLLSLTAALLAAGCASTAPVTQVPPQLQAGPGERLTQVVAATGVQIYECRARAGAAGDYEWAFSEAATLLPSCASQCGPA